MNKEEKYADYAEKKREEIAEDRQTEAEILKEIYHDLNYDMKTVINFSEELFDRMKKDEDFLLAAFLSSLVVGKLLNKNKHQNK